MKIFETFDELPVGTVLIPTCDSLEISVWLVLAVNGTCVNWLNLETGHTYIDTEGDRTINVDWEILLP